MERSRRGFGSGWPAALVVVGLLGCGSDGDDTRRASAAPPELPAHVQSTLPLHPGVLYDLCPVTDVPREIYDEFRRRTRREARALIREVRRRPDAVVVRVSEDAHTGEEFSERLTVLEVAEEHLREPGVEGVPCARRLMTELRDAVARARGEEPPPSAPPVDEPVYLMEEVAAKLRLRARGAIYRNAHCREVQTILTSREEVEIALDEPIRNVETITPAERTVGVQAFQPTTECRRFLERRLEALVGR